MSLILIIIVLLLLFGGLGGGYYGYRGGYYGGGGFGCIGLVVLIILLLLLFGGGGRFWRATPHGARKVYLDEVAAAITAEEPPCPASTSQHSSNAWRSSSRNPRFL